MAFIDPEDLHDLYLQSKEEGDEWRKDYHEYERLADNDLSPEQLEDENLPEVNDGTLAASLFKLPKRIVNSKLKGRFRALDADEAWITELANMQWENEIIPHANTQAPFHRKWKDGVRKAAIYGGQPVITLLVNRDDYTGADIILPQAQDVTLEAGKVSDYDSDIIFWDVYFSKAQFKSMIEDAKEEMRDAEETEEGSYNKWDIPAMEKILKSKQEDERDSRQEHHQKDGRAVKKSGFHFYIAFQRGKQAPFYMCHAAKAGKDLEHSVIREWSNPDPTGDVPVHYIYCYQDFINPYGIGIVKLAGGTQNVLDYFRKADILATQLGIRPPKKIKGSINNIDLDSFVYAQDADWLMGTGTDVERMEISNGVYQQLPDRIAMYKTSLNQLIPTGDTTIGAAAGDPQYSKTPAGVKFQAASLSIDDEDFKDNLYMTYEAVAKSMINTHFANMQGTDLMKLSDDERDILMKAGLEFPVDENGDPTNELEIFWDEARATFTFEMDAEQDKTKDDEKRLEGLVKVADFVKDPNTQTLITTGQPLIIGTKKLDPGELVSEIITLTTDNKKIIQDITPEDQELMAEEEALADEQAMADAQATEEAPMGEEPSLDGEISMEQAMVNVQAVMEQYGVDQRTAAAMLEAERQGFEPDEIMAAAARFQEAGNG